MAVITGDIVPLNRSEHGYAAIEGLASTMVQAYVLRFNEPVPEERVRRTLRELVTAYPKLRAALEPGLHRYHLRILPEGPLIDQMFEQAYRVDPHIDVDDPLALEAWHRDRLHDVVPLERGLGFRARFVPHPERAVLAFGMPHIFGDGMTMLELVKQILRGLNGQPLQPMALEAPSMLGSIAPEKWWQWPRQVWLSRRHKVEEARRLAGVNIQQWPTQLGTHFSTMGLRHHDVPTPVADMRRTARELGVSLNTFLMAALAQTFLDQAPDDPKAAAVIRISVNLRKYYPASAGHGSLWGNHVGAFLVIEQDVRKPLRERVKSIDASIKEGLDRYARREMCWTYLIEEALPWLGRTLIGHIGVQLKRKGKFPKISCHATNLGDANHVNLPDAAVRVVQIVPSVNSISPLPAVVEMNGRLSLPWIWQLGETPLAAVDDFNRRFDATLARMVAELSPQGAAA